MRAGVDRREQKKASAALEQQLLRKGREASGVLETHETRRADRNRADLANQYDGFDMRVR